MGFVIGNVSSSIVQYYDSFILPVGGGGGGGQCSVAGLPHEYVIVKLGYQALITCVSVASNRSWGYQAVTL